MRPASLVLLLALFLALAPAASAKAPKAKEVAQEPEPVVKIIESRLTGQKAHDKAKELMDGMLDDGDNLAVAHLADAKPDSTLREYRFFASTLLPAWLSLSREVLTDYTVFKEIVPFVDGATYDAQSRILDLSGGVWGYKLHSLIRFTEKHERWIRYEIIAGSFRGLTGDLIFESKGEKGTVVILTGDASNSTWPPALVMEQGAVLVLTRTAANMKSYLIGRKRAFFDAKPPTSSKGSTPGAKTPKGEEKNVEELPQPRSHL